MALPIPHDLEPMEAELADVLPTGDNWLYEPKWDGFRCLLFRDGAEVELRSKAGKPLARYFPDVVEIALALPEPRYALDGEIVVSVDGALAFDELLQRIHPAESRVRKLASQHPASFITFDLLAEGRKKMITRRLSERRPALEAFAGRLFDAHDRIHLSPATADAEIARNWLESPTADLDGVMAKRLDLPYQAGNRAGMLKVKRMRTADCVVGGFRWTKDGQNVASLLLGLYEGGELHHVGFCSALNRKVRAEADDRLRPLRGGEGFTGRAPGGPSRWRKEGSGDWEPLRPGIVVEVGYDHFTGGRFRHGTRFLRWRPDKAPEQCTMGQVTRGGGTGADPAGIPLHPG